MTAPRTPRRSPARIFAWPLVILAASLAGLVLGLLGTGWRDALACALLAAGPLFVALHHLIRTKEPR